jgi:MtN3 and saliva related transmembrane protein
MLEGNNTVLDFKTQEYFGWAGNFIFLSAQISQVFYTFKVKRTNDISYSLQVLLLIGNIMYTAFGVLDKSLSIFIGNLLTVFTAIIQIIQKIHYDKINHKYIGLYDEIN